MWIVSRLRVAVCLKTGYEILSSVSSNQIFRRGEGLGVCVTNKYGKIGSYLPTVRSAKECAVNMP